jgi:hypothetical protein
MPLRLCAAGASVSALRVRRLSISVLREGHSSSNSSAVAPESSQEEHADFFISCSRLCLA